MIDKNEIMEVLRRGEPLSVRDIAFKLGCNQKDVSRVLVEMRDENLITGDLATLTVRRTLIGRR